MAIIYEAPHRLESVLEVLDISPLELAEGARAAGLALPDLDPAELPAPMGPYGPKVVVEAAHAVAVRRGLKDRLGLHTFWGTNRTDDGRVWFFAERATDLPAVIAEILGDPELIEVRPLAGG